MAPYQTEGSLTTDKREIDDSDGWDSQSDWEAYQSASNVEIVDGAVQLEESAIPDPSDLHAHYDFREYSGTSGFADLSGNGNDLVNGSITGVSASINGQQAGEFDGSDDGLWTDTFSDILPATFAAVIMPDTANDDDPNAVLATNSTDFAHIEWQAGDSNWRMFRGSGITGSSTYERRVISGYAESGSSSVLREDGSQTAIGDAGTRPWDMHVISPTAASPAEERAFQGSIGEILIYDSDKSAILPDIDQYLIDSWGLSL